MKANTYYSQHREERLEYQRCYNKNGKKPLKISRVGIKRKPKKELRDICNAIMDKINEA